jgi:hypothetical protein
MSDRESETSPTGQATESASFSTNGTDPGGFGSDAGSTESGFLAELAKAMQSTAAAEQARSAEETEQRRQSHIDAIRAREAIEAEELRELAKEDVKGIDAWSDGEIKRIKLERERRIAARREQLQIRLEEHRTVVGREVEAVEASVGAYRADIAEYFRRLESETDPVAIAKFAGSRPPFPDLDQIGPEDIAGSTGSGAAASEPWTPAPVEAVQASADVVEAPVETIEVTEAVAEPEPETPVETNEAATAEQETPLVAVMETESADETPEGAWDSGEAAPAEQSEEAVPAALQEEPVAGEATNEGSEGSEGSGEPEEAKEEEPVGAVVMPRSTGAGSWLRWPNSSGNDPEN